MSPSISQAVQKDLSAKGTYALEPTVPAKAPKGKKVMLISCGQAITACAFDTGAAQQAATKLGWQSTLYDTKGVVTAAADALHEAITGHYDGVFLYFIDCNYVRSALQAAKNAGIPVVAAEGYDCNQVQPGAPSLFAYQVHYQNLDLPAYARAWGQAIADYAIWKLHGASNALAFADDTERVNTFILQGFKDEYKKCAKCSLKIVTFPYADFGTGKIAGLVSDNLLRYPDVNTSLTTYEAISLEVHPAIQASHRHILEFVGEGGPPGMQLLRNGVSGYGDGWSLDWEGWSAIDALVRIFDHQKPLPSGIGVQTVTPTQNLPKSGRFRAPFDYQSMYLRDWGVG